MDKQRPKMDPSPTFGSSGQQPANIKPVSQPDGTAEQDSRAARNEPSAIAGTSPATAGAKQNAGSIDPSSTTNATEGGTFFREQHSVDSAGEVVGTDNLRIGKDNAGFPYVADAPKRRGAENPTGPNPTADKPSTEGAGDLRRNPDKDEAA
jgi:hypothetical protein